MKNNYRYDGKLPSQILLAFILLISSLNVKGQCNDTLVARYNFGTTTSGTITHPLANSGIAAGITATSSSSMSSSFSAGVAAANQAFYTASAGAAITIASPASSTQYFQFQLSSTNLVNYGSFDVYFQANQAFGANTSSSALEWSINGTSFTSAGSLSIGGTNILGTKTWNQNTFSNISVSNPTNLYFRIKVVTGAIFGTTWNIDNFQIRANKVLTAPTTTSTSICNGGAATITASASAGTSISWFCASSGGNSQFIGASFSPANGICSYNNGVSGTYNFYALDSLTGCVTSRTLSTITVASPLVADISPSAPSICNGLSVGLTANGVGGGTPYSYSWSPTLGLSSSTDQSPTASPTTTTTYTVTITDNCSPTATATATVQVTVNSLPPVAITPTPSSAAICNSGSVSLVAIGANSYVWTPAVGLSATAGSTITATPPASNIYKVTGTDGNGCTNTATIFVKTSPAISASASATPALICPNGSSNLSASANYAAQYSVSAIPISIIAPVSAQAGPTLNDLTTGPIPIPFSFNFFNTTYNDLYICSNGYVQFGSASPSNIYSQTLPNAAAPNNIIAGVWCDLDPSSAGTISYFTTGTAPNRIFVINYSGVKINGNNFLATPRATFQIQLFETMNIAEVHISSVVQPDLLLLPPPTTCAIKNSNGSSFFGAPSRYNNGAWAATNEAYRFVPQFTTFTYNWSPPDFLSATNISNPTAQNVTASTTYTVTASDANGCTLSATTGFTVNTIPVSVSCASNLGNDVCSGSSMTLSSTPSGGLSPYSYSWSTGATTQNISFSASSTQTYTVTLSDVCGSSQSCQITLNVNQTPTASIAGGSPQTLCAGAILTAVTNAVTPSYQWKLNGNNVGTNSSSYIPTSTGSYTVVVTDNAMPSLCSATSSGVAVTVSVLPLANLTPTGSLSTCTGQTQLLNVTSSQPATFTNNTVINIPGTLLGAVNATPYPSALPVSGISLGSTVASININLINSTNGVLANLQNLDIVLVSPTGVATVIMSDVGNTDVANVSYTFQDGATTMPTSSQASPPSGIYSCTNNGLGDNWPSPGPGTPSGQVLNPVLSSFTGNPNGNWNLFIRNDNTGISLDQTIASWSITFNPPTFNYAWSVYPPTSLSSVSPLTGSATTATVNDTATFIVTVTDPSSGCTNTASVIYNSIPNPAPKLNFTDSAVCSATPFIDLIVQDSGYYSAGYPNNTLFAWINDLGVSYTPPTANLNSYSINQPDDYKVVVILPGAYGGCYDTSNVAHVSFGYPSPLQFMQQDSVDCYGDATGKAYVDLVIPGNPPYNYQWFNSANVLVRDTTGTHLSDSLLNLTSGWYKLHITTNYGNPSPPPFCDVWDSIYVEQPQLLTVSQTNITHVSCFGAGNGSISVTGVDGNLSYTYLWSNNSTNATATGLIPGTYTVTVSDYHNCVATASYSITQPELLITGISKTDALCNDGYSGTSTAAPSGGTAPYTYSWSTSPVQHGITATGLHAGTYTVIVTDVNNCSVTNSILVGEATAIVITKSVTNVLCKGTATGAIDLTVNGGTPGQGYTYTWNNFAVTEDISSLAKGTYSVTVTDANGCTKTDITPITEPTSVVVVSIAKVNIRCYGKSTGTATANASGGTSPYSYSWSNGASTAGISNLTAGIYTVTVTDSKGCSKSMSASLTQNPNMTVLIIPTPTSATATPSGGIAPYSYIWNSVPTQSTSTATGLTPGSTYKVKVTDSKGCSSLTLVTLPNPKLGNAQSQNNLLNNVLVYPNPNDGLFTIDFGIQLTESNGEISVINMSGQLVKYQPIALASGNNEKTFDFSDLSKGIYQLKITVAGHSVIKRLTIQ